MTRCAIKPGWKRIKGSWIKLKEEVIKEEAIKEEIIIEKEPEEVIPLGYKKCTKCLEIKKLDKFNVKTRAPDGRCTHCKTCREKHRKYKRSRRYYWIHKYQLAKGCRICGYKESPYALQFNHIEPSNKNNNISVLMQSGTNLKKLFSEIRKCEILCANCHAAHTHSENHHLTKKRIIGIRERQ